MLDVYKQMKEHAQWFLGQRVELDILRKSGARQDILFEQSDACGEDCLNLPSDRKRYQSLEKLSHFLPVVVDTRLRPKYPVFYPHIPYIPGTYPFYIPRNPPNIFEISRSNTTYLVYIPCGPPNIKYLRNIGFKNKRLLRIIINYKYKPSTLPSFN